MLFVPFFCLLVIRDHIPCPLLSYILHRRFSRCLKMDADLTYSIRNEVLKVYLL